MEAHWVGPTVAILSESDSPTDIVQWWGGPLICLREWVQVNLLPIVVLPKAKLDFPLEQDAQAHVWLLYLL